MSLVDFIKLNDVAERLRAFRPPVGLKDIPLKVSSRGCPQLVGTAFDYLLRFELQRRAPHAVASEWVAEQVPRRIYGPGIVSGTWVARDFLINRPDLPYTPPEAVAERVAAVCRGAREAQAEYVRNPGPDRETKFCLARWALRLAKLDGVVRRNEFDHTFEDASDDLADELVDLLAGEHIGHLVHPDMMLLNPNFGGASDAVGGADADLISGDLLVDFKTTKSAEVNGQTLDQLFGYFLLARRAGMPEIKRMGGYLSRYGVLRVGQTFHWTNRTDFAETEAWFFERARKVFRPQSQPVARAAPRARSRRKRIADRSCGLHTRRGSSFFASASARERGILHLATNLHLSAWYVLLLAVAYSALRILPLRLLSLRASPSNGLEPHRLPPPTGS